MQTTPHSIKRILRYINERFPLHLHGLFGLISFYSLYLLWHTLRKGEIRISIFSVIGALTMIGMLLLLRTFDELKDFETDKRVFPDRPLPAGRVTHSDLYYLSVFLTITMLALNLSFWNWVTIYFIVLYGYSFLMFKWFFLPHIISNNILLTLITHQLYIPLSYGYVAVIAAFECGDKTLDLFGVSAIVLFWAPFLCWEIARKIRAPGCETDNQTYSMLLGPIKATLICLGLVILIGIMLFIVFYPLKPTIIFIYVCSVAICLVVFSFVRFIITPTERNSDFNPIIKIFILILYISIIFELLLTRRLIW